MSLDLRPGQAERHAGRQAPDAAGAGAGKGLGEADLAGTPERLPDQHHRPLPAAADAAAPARLAGRRARGRHRRRTSRCACAATWRSSRSAPTTRIERARGEFRVAGRIENGKLNYTPGRLAKDGKSPLWPQAENINGSIVFDRTRHGDQGRQRRHRRRRAGRRQGGDAGPAVARHAARDRRQRRRPAAGLPALRGGQPGARLDRPFHRRRQGDAPTPSWR